MKQTKKAKTKEKDNYMKFSFLFPVVVSAVGAVIMAAFIFVMANRNNFANIELAKLIANVGAVRISLSPTFLLVTAYTSFKHMKKHPDGSAFYVKAPMIISVLVWGAQVIYMSTMMA
jgi:hypothetical protein